MIKLSKTVGYDYKVNTNDVLIIKTALRDLGYYKIPDYGLTPYPDNSMFESIRKFQSDNGLTTDGIINPAGETIEALNERYDNDLPSVRSPTSWCTKCGGPHGGSKGGMCPDCDKKS